MEAELKMLWRLKVVICQCSWIEKAGRPVHYRLRPIESVQFRFDNLGSHFIRAQIFQIDFRLTPFILSASKYFRYSCRGQNELLMTISHYNTITNSQLLKK